MTNNHINKLSEYVAYTTLIINTYNSMLFDIKRNYFDIVKLDVKTAKAWIASKGHNFSFQYCTMIFYSLDDNRLAPAGRIIHTHQELFIQAFINVLERTDILNEHVRLDKSFETSEMGQEHIKFIDVQIKYIKSCMMKLTVSNRFLQYKKTMR